MCESKEKGHVGRLARIKVWTGKLGLKKYVQKFKKKGVKLLFKMALMEVFRFREGGETILDENTPN